MIPNSSYNVSSVQTSQLPIQLTQIEGIGRSDIAAGTYLQLHDSCIAPATGAVPLWELPVSASTQFQETLQVARCNLTEGCFLGLSTTAGTYTAATTHMDITVWTDVVVLSTNAVGDKTTAVAGKQIWSRTTTTKQLYQLIMTEQSGQTQYVYISACNLADPLYTNQGFIFTLGPNVTKKFTFGVNEGLVPFYNDILNNLGNGAQLYTGCTIMFGQKGAQNGATVTPIAAGTCAILAITN